VGGGYALRRTSEARTRSRNWSGVPLSDAVALTIAGAATLAEFFLGFTCREPLQLPGCQLLRLGVDRFGLCLLTDFFDSAFLAN
jgi:hypothetical protein